MLTRVISSFISTHPPQREPYSISRGIHDLCVIRVLVESPRPGQSKVPSSRCDRVLSTRLRCNDTAFLTLIFIVTSMLVAQVFLTLRSVVTFQHLNVLHLMINDQAVRVISAIQTLLCFLFGLVSWSINFRACDD